MAGIVGTSTTFNNPNYVGELFNLSPQETPLLSAIGGLTGGKAVQATKFAWQTIDDRNPDMRQRLEGAAPPSGEARVRSNVENVVEIHQEKVSVSYSRQAATQLIATPQAAPFTQGAGENGVVNPVNNELDLQVQHALKSMAKDINYSFWNGTFANPTSNATARQTRGILQAVVSNNVSTISYTSAALTSATNNITESATPRANGDRIVFTNVGSGSNLVLGQKYFIVGKTTNTFQVATTAAGAPITVGTQTTLVYTVGQTTAITVDQINSMAQRAFDGGGVSSVDTTVLFVPSAQKVNITKAYATAYGNTATGLGGATRNVGGVSVTEIQTDFGILGLAVDRWMPSDTVAMLSLDQMNPVFMLIPGKGFLFEEQMAITGASIDVQIYGEVGLEYGNEAAHAVLRGLPF